MAAGGRKFHCDVHALRKQRNATYRGVVRKREKRIFKYVSSFELQRETISNIGRSERHSSAST